MAMGLKLGFGLTNKNTGGGASAYASSAAPHGYRWDFITYLGERVTYLGTPVVALVEAV